MSRFQIIVLGFFVFCAVGGLILFASFSRQPSGIEKVVLWGTLDRNSMNDFIAAAMKAQGSKIEVQYIQRPPETIYQDYLEAVASRYAPDALLLSQDQILKFAGKIITIPYSTISQQEFKSTYIQEGELYLTENGIRAIPFTIDPLVMYWNRDIFSNVGISSPPKYWSELKALAQKITKRDSATKISQSAVGIGEFRNVDHAKELLSLLILQLGNPIAANTQYGMQSFLNAKSGNSSPALNALNFYTDFANPVKDIYTWNKSLPSSQLMFIGNRLGVYFGYASEYDLIHQKNSNLNYGVTLMPQITSQPSVPPVNITYGKLYGFSISNTTFNFANTLNVVRMLTNTTAAPLWADKSHLPSVRRDALTMNPSDSTSYIFGLSSLWSRGWLDPDYVKTTTIFGDMIDSVTSNRQDSDVALQQAHDKLQNLLNP
jgi:ABC-type glycerol-3-phosphate transport system substrate-binding protein